MKQFLVAISVFLCLILFGCSASTPYTIFDTKQGADGVTLRVDVPHGATNDQMKQWSDEIKGTRSEKFVMINFYDGSHDLSGFVGSYQIDQFFPSLPGK